MTDELPDPSPPIPEPPPEPEKPFKPGGKHLFKKGWKPTARRAKGTRNKITVDIKNGIIHGAVAHGSDGKGKGGLLGYFELCARKHRREYMVLLARLLPLDLSAKADFSMNVRLVAAPSGLFLPAEKIRELSGLPPLIEPPEPPLVIEPAEPEPEPATAIESEAEETNVVRVFTTSRKKDQR